MNGHTADGGKETLACLIIDDPLLRPRYGCIDYLKLLNAMKAHNFFTEIAFIPWNCRRSDPETVRLFAANPDRFALCVHGCNHTGNEFGGTNYLALKNLATAAIWGMEQHRDLTGLPYDPVMVFPQGRFSSVAMNALKETGYVAAFNSSIEATDAGKPPAVEYLRPATTIYHGFPLFLRRYPKDKLLFLNDITLGRPILIVEHHHAFRDGYRGITDLVDCINRSGTIRWTSLLTIAQHYHDGATATAQSARSPIPPHRAAKIALRRYLSEFRDDYVETSTFWTGIYKKVRRLG